MMLVVTQAITHISIRRVRKPLITIPNQNGDVRLLHLLHWKPPMYRSALVTRGALQRPEDKKPKRQYQRVKIHTQNRLRPYTMSQSAKRRVDVQVMAYRSRNW